MPRIPQRGMNANLQKPRATPDLAEPMPEVAFGGRQAEAMVGLGRSIQGVGSMLGEHAARMRQEEINKKALELATVAHGELNKSASAALDRMGNNAEGVATEFDKSADEIFKKATEGLKDPQIYEAAHKLYVGAVESNLNQIVRHEAQQRREAINSAAKSMIGVLLDDSQRYDDPKDLLLSVNRAVGVLRDNLLDNGEPPETIAKATKDMAEKAIFTNLSVLLDTDPVKAKANLETLKGQLDPDVYGKVEKAIDGKFFELKQPEMWDRVQPLVARSDGSYDTEQIRVIVDDMTDVPQPMKDKLQTYFEGRAREAESNYKSERANNESQFMDAAYKLKKDGASIDEIKKALVPKYGIYGPADMAEKEKDINKMFDTNALDDTELYTKLSWQLQLNEISLKDVQAQRGNLNESSYKALKREYIGNVVNPQTGFKAAQDEIMAIMQAKGIKGKPRQARFIAALKAKIGDRKDVTADVYVELAREEAKKVMVNKWVDLPVVGAIGKMQPQYMIETPEPGTPEYMAVQRLQSANKAITPESIKLVIGRHPEWMEK